MTSRRGAQGERPFPLLQNGGNFPGPTNLIVHAAAPLLGEALPDRSCGLVRTAGTKKDFDDGESRRHTMSDDEPAIGARAVSTFGGSARPAGLTHSEPCPDGVGRQRHCQTWVHPLEPRLASKRTPALLRLRAWKLLLPDVGHWSGLHCFAGKTVSRGLAKGRNTSGGPRASTACHAATVSTRRHLTLTFLDRTHRRHDRA